MTDARAFLLPESLGSAEAVPLMTLSTTTPPALTPAQALTVASIIRQVSDAMRQYSLRARWRAAEDDSLVPYANGAADAALAGSIAATQALAELTGRR